MIWADNIIGNLCGGFNHIKNYITLKNLNEYQDDKIEIVEGFLVLETEDNKFRISDIEDVQEMFQKYYGIDYNKFKNNE